MQNIARIRRTAAKTNDRMSSPIYIFSMKSLADSIRNRTAALVEARYSARDIVTVLAQGITVLRIAALVLVLYVKFKLEHFFDRHQG